MIASAQVEPASGWTYTPIVNEILKAPDTTGEALGEIICDEYKKANKKNGDHKKITMATYNLSKIDPVLQEIDKMSKHISETIIILTKLKGRLKIAIASKRFFTDGSIA